MTNPWNGVLTATATPFKADLSIDYDKYAEHVAWLAANGTHGVIPNGSLGEYQVLTAEERAKMVEVAVAAAPKGFSVVPGVAAYGAAESRKWAEHAQKAGAGAVMLLPPNAYRASDDEVVAHYKEVARVGIPIIAYNNPFDTKVDLTPKLVARIADEVPGVVAIKEFSGDVRRIWQIKRLAPRIEVIVGADDVFLELATLELLDGSQGFQMRFLRNRWSSTTLQLLETSKRQLLCMQRSMMSSIGIQRRNLSKRSSLEWTMSVATADQLVYLDYLYRLTNKRKFIASWMLLLLISRTVNPK